MPWIFLAVSLIGATFSWNAHRPLLRSRTLSAPSFMAGWLAKLIITRFGGGAGYRRARAFFIGIIAGEVVAGVGWMIVGALYYAYYRVTGPSFRVHW